MEIETKSLNLLARIVYKIIAGNVHDINLLEG
jgi:hypothetical protein